MLHYRRVEHLANTQYANVESTGLTLDVDETSQEFARDELGGSQLSTHYLKSAQNASLEANLQSTYNESQLPGGGIAAASNFAYTANGFGQFEVVFGFERSLTATGNEVITINRSLSFLEIGESGISRQGDFQIYDNANDRLLYDGSAIIGIPAIDEYDEYTFTSTLIGVGSQWFYSFTLADVVSDYDLSLDWNSDYSIFLPDSESNFQAITLSDQISIQPSVPSVPEPATYALITGLSLIAVTCLRNRRN